MDVLSTVLVIAGIIIALAFNFSNGRNDAANTIATVVATHAISPRKAIIVASICCFLGPFVFSTAVAKTIGKGIVNPEFLTPLILFIGLCGAVVWVNICSHYGIPVSSSHSLVGGLLGVGLAAGGAAYIYWPTPEMFFGMLKFLGIGVAAGVLLGILLAILCKDKIRTMAVLGGVVGFVLAVPVAMITVGFQFSGILAILLFICVSPVLGLIVSFLFTSVLTRILARFSKHPMKMNKWFQRAQILGSGFQAMSLGGNDAQNAMGMIFAILVSAGFLSSGSELPLWVILASALAITLGILSGGWKVIKKLGSGITRIMPYQGFSAAVSGGAVLSFMTMFGVPVSTTHCAAGSVMGTGVTRGVGAVNWRTVRQMVTAWVITIPCAGIVSFIGYMVLSVIFGF